jgi:hypothetical protein
MVYLTIRSLFWDMRPPCRDDADIRAAPRPNDRRHSSIIENHGSQDSDFELIETIDVDEWTAIERDSRVKKVNLMFVDVRTSLFLIPLELHAPPSPKCSYLA